MKRATPREQSPGGMRGGGMGGGGGGGRGRGRGGGYGRGECVCAWCASIRVLPDKLVPIKTRKGSGGCCVFGNVDIEQVNDSIM